MEKDYSLLFDIIRQRSYRRGTFKLASGEISHHYFNLKPTLLDPQGARLCGDLMAKLIKQFSDPPFHISGLAVGAVPLIATMAASDVAEIRGTFVRKQIKDHGTQEAIEGLAANETLSGKNVIIIEDVCTTGGSIIEAVTVIRATGAIVTDAATIIERGGRDALSAEGIELHSIFHENEFV